MSVPLRINYEIAIWLILISLFVAACGPKTDETFDLSAASTDQDLVKIGEKIFFGKGQCALCHTLGGEGRGKCPDLKGAGERLTREFIYEALTKPDEYVKRDYDPVEPKEYPARMPTINKPPIGLTEPELLTVIAFVQSRGGAVTVSPTELKKSGKTDLTRQ